MELKVWVEGIQRVVCGANYSTTCQDVVLALAHAMGRTGRFTLVERWRDSERPLTPAECPLQALHKWGEYAGEVRFFLIQADGNVANTSNNSIGSNSSRSSKDGDRTAGTKNLPPYPRSRQSSENDANVNRSRDTKPHHGTSFPSSPSPSPRGGFTSGSSQAPQKPYHSHLQHLQQSEHLKRSSTFSGAHNYALQPPQTSSSSYSNNIAVPPMSSLNPSSQQFNAPYHTQQRYPEHHPPPSSSSSRDANKYNNQTKYSNQTLPQKTRRPSHGQQNSLAPPLSNGVDYGMSGNSSSNSSPRSPSALSASQNYNAPSGYFQAPNSLSSSNSVSHPIRDRSGPRVGDQRDQIPKDSRELHPANPGYSRTSASSYGSASRGTNSSAAQVRPKENSSQHQSEARHRHPRRERRPRSPTPHRSGTAGQQQNAQNQPSIQQPKHGPQPPYPHNQHVPTNTFYHSAPQRHDQQDSSPRDGFPVASPSTSPAPPIPAPRHRGRPSPETVEYENLPSSRGRDLQRNQHRPQQPQEYQPPPPKPPSPRRRDRSQSRDRRRDEAGDVARSDARPGSRGTGASWSAPAPQASGGPPVWTQAGRVGDAQRQHPHAQHPNLNQRQQQQLSKSLPASGMNLLRRNNEGGLSGIGGSVDFVESAAKRQNHQHGPNTSTNSSATDNGESRSGHKSGADLSYRATEPGRHVSSFASAVANIRQHSKERSPRRDGYNAGDQPSSFQPEEGQHYKNHLGDSTNFVYSSLPCHPDHHAATSPFTNEVNQQQKWNNSQFGQFYNSHHNQIPHQHNPYSQPNIPSDNRLSYPHSGYQKTPSPREPTSPPSLTLSPRQNSAFKEVSPRHSNQLSPSSPPAAFSFDENKNSTSGHEVIQENIFPREGHDDEDFGYSQVDSVPERHPHFRQLSLEVEEYDLDQNFPDLSQRDRDFNASMPTSARETGQRSNLSASTTGGTAHMESTPLEYRLDNGGVRPAPHRAEAEYLQLARLVSVQQDRIKVIEAQIADASAGEFTVRSVSPVCFI
ncbi:Ras association domain-containing protein 10 [Elysia marginata]|uniref:Ras association domain-containing protein 10 n=1 Tax=Elysia marginata TaxID=1093978 RepID=A0AAV4HPX0_9GAST|nr:Ras association domain-containing protein 10 [Elysia marginata]